MRRLGYGTASDVHYYLGTRYTFRSVTEILARHERDGKLVHIGDTMVLDARDRRVSVKLYRVNDYASQGCQESREEDGQA